MTALTFARDGAEHHPGLASPILPDVAAIFAGDSLPGQRIGELGGLLAALGPESAIGALVADRIGATARPVRAIAFDKCDAANWSLGWHQDRVIAVRARREVAGYGPWTIKRGVHHVQPPVKILDRMATVRIHLDPVDANNAPLKIAPGSHKLGRIAEPDIARVVASCGEAMCLAEPGDLWIYATLILHASERAAPGRRRRVLQLDFSADRLSGGLEWQQA